ncbi:MAG: AAA family ATPase [Alphaproteobacteria bacterium]|nr:AAA family ATPase [Alphaproteobacteria bacterium]
MAKKPENDSIGLTHNAEASVDSALPENYSYHQDLYFPPDTSNNILPILSRRKILALSISFFCFGIGLLAIEYIPTIYRAHAQLAFPNQNNAFIETQLHMMQNSNSARGLKLQEVKRARSTHNAYTFISSERLNFTHIPNSYIVNLSYDSHSAVQSALTLNRFINAYMKQIKQVPPPSSSFTVLPSLVLTPKYQKAQTRYLELKVQLSAFIGGNGRLNVHNNKAALDHLHSGLLDNLLERKRRYDYGLENLFLRYGEKHPRIINIRAEILALEKQIKQEREALLANLIDEYISAKKMRDTLAEKASKHEKEIASQRPAQQNIMQLIKPAIPPQNPIFPDKPRLIALSALVSLFLGLLIPVIVERSRKTFLSGRRLSHSFGLPCYALIPETKKEDDEILSDYVLNYPSSTLVEALRSLRLNIKLKNGHFTKDNKVILVTSSKDNEGKTTLCTWLGRLAAKSGEKVLLIDANLRAPAVHQALNGENTMSLIEYLTGKASLNEVIDKSTDPSGMHIIYGRAAPNSALDLLSTKKMGQLIEDMKASYDLVIIDTPSCLTNADARALSPHSDLLLYLVSWNKTKRNVIHRGLLQFLNFAHIRTALVLSNINLKKHVKYGYGEVIYEEQA